MSYYFDFNPEAKLVVVVDEQMPAEDAVGRTGRTIRVFGWREGILRAIRTVEGYLEGAQLDSYAARVRLNGRPKQMPDGRTFECCASCGYSPEADKTMWREVIAGLDKELEVPPA